MKIRLVVGVGKWFLMYIKNHLPTPTGFLFSEQVNCINRRRETSTRLSLIPMKAGFAKENINPPIGTRMTGFGARDRDRGCEAIHDDIYVRALYLTHEGREVLIMGFDLLFFSRDEADRYKGAIGRRIDLAPSQILLNTSHSHLGPKVGTWLYDPPSDPLYLQALEQAILNTACHARDTAVEVTIRAGVTRSALPMSRRVKLENGKVAQSLQALCINSATEE